VAVARRRVPWAARGVAVTRAVDFTLYNDAVAVVTVMAVNEHREDGSDEEEDDIPESVIRTQILLILRGRSRGRLT
jgi:hypothetical protein